MDFEQDVKIEITDDNIKQISSLAKLQVQIEGELSDLEDLVKDTKKNLRKVQEEDLPLAMREAGMLEFTLESGEKISIEQGIFPSIPKPKILAAYDWLRGHGHGAIIKNLVTVQFSAGADEDAHKLLKSLTDDGFKPSQKESIHASTLKAFVKEQMADPDTEELPEDLFTVFEVSKAVVKTS